MNLSTKILLFLFAVFAVGLTGFIIYKEHEISVQQEAIQKQLTAQKELTDNVLRSMSQYTTKTDLEQFVKDQKINLQAIQDDLSKLNASLTAVNQATTSSKGQTATNLSSTTSHPDPTTQVPTVNCDGKQIACPNADPYGYSQNTQVLNLTENFSNTTVPVGDVSFSASKDKPWSVDIKPREYNTTTVIGTDENQKIYAYNKFTIKVDDKNYDVNLTKGVTEQVYPTAKFSFWNPRLYLTTGGAVNLSSSPLKGSANVGVNLGIMSYGQYKNLPDISVLQLGVGYQTQTQRPSFTLSPVNFNIKPIFPKGLVDNTYLGPSAQIDTGGNVFTGVNLSIGF